MAVSRTREGCVVGGDVATMNCARGAVEECLDHRELPAHRLIGPERTIGAAALEERTDTGGRLLMRAAHVLGGKRALGRHDQRAEPVRQVPARLQETLEAVDGVAVEIEAVEHGLGVGDRATRDLSDQGGPVVEVPVERHAADAGGLGDVADAGAGIGREQGGGGLHDGFDIAPGIGALRRGDVSHATSSRTEVSDFSRTPVTRACAGTRPLTSRPTPPARCRWDR